jgi:anti-sigma B factor antagonist
MDTREIASGDRQVVSVETLDDQGALVVVDGDLDIATAAQLRTAISSKIRDGHRHFVVDLSDATFLDSMAMGTLLYSIMPIRHDPDAAVVLAGVHGIVERALTISNIGAMFSTFDTRSDALRGIRDEVLQEGWRSLQPRPYPSL